MVLQFGTRFDDITIHVRSEFHVLIIVTLNVAVPQGNTVCTDGDITTSTHGWYSKQDSHAHHEE